jgi:hypothetical protein
VHVPYVGVMQQRVIEVCGNQDYQQITLTAEAKFCAVANFDGTKFRVIEMQKGSLVQEVTRGFKSATVTSISLSPCTEDSWYLAAATLKNTVHVFMVGQAPEIKNVKHSLNMMGSFLPTYFSSEFSFAQYKIQTDSQQPKICVIRDGALYVLDDVQGQPKYYMA